MRVESRSRTEKASSIAIPGVLLAKRVGFAFSGY
jgi:hypothetical protein